MERFNKKQDTDCLELRLEEMFPEGIYRSCMVDIYGKVVPQFWSVVKDGSLSILNIYITFRWKFVYF